MNDSPSATAPLRAGYNSLVPLQLQSNSTLAAQRLAIIGSTTQSIKQASQSKRSVWDKLAFWLERRTKQPKPQPLRVQPLTALLAALPQISKLDISLPKLTTSQRLMPEFPLLQVAAAQPGKTATMVLQQHCHTFFIPEKPV